MSYNHQDPSFSDPSFETASKPNLKNRLFCCLFMLTALCLPGIAGDEGFNGEWRTSFGKLILTADGADVSGTFYNPAGDGTVNGRLSADAHMLNGRWSTEQTSGHFVMRLLKEDNAFYGKWWQDGQDITSEWYGVRSNKSLTNMTIKANEFTGHWMSNYGRMNLSYDGIYVSGTFRGKKNYGAIKGEIFEKRNNLIASWEDKNFKGKLIIRLLEGGSGFIGEWWYSDHEYGGYWYGTRVVPIEACISGDCEDGYGTYIWQNGDRYEGSWQKGIYHGKGKQYDARGVLQKQGIWSKGLYQGKCLEGDCETEGDLELLNGDRYVGPLKNFTPEGNGRYIYANGDVYEGFMRSLSPNGKGKIVFGNGDIYEGRFRRGKYEGRGAYTTAAGDSLTGTFRQGQPNGRGKINWANGDRFSGSLKMGQLSGRGDYYYKDGDHYKGSFSEGLKAGKGVYTFANGTSFEGQWENDRAEEYEPSDSDYSGLADKSANGSRPVTMRNRPLFEIQKPGSADSSHFYFISRVDEKSGPAADDERPVKEVVIQYYVVASDAELAEPTVREYLKKQHGIANASLQFEAVEDPAGRLKKITDQYRFGVDKVRINISGARYFNYSESN